MAVFFDLDEDDETQSHSQSRSDIRSSISEGRQLALQSKLIPNGRKTEAQPLDGTAMANNIHVDPSKIHRLAAAVTCYPIALSLASHLDLNDLDALAATCRIVHQCLQQYARQLKAHSLRCAHDGPPLAEMLAVNTGGLQMEEPVIDVSIYAGSTFLQPVSHTAATTRTGSRATPDGLYSSSGVSSKISACARDLVSSCRKCGIVVCRNCTIKPPTNAWLKDRYRRLCKTCLDAPFEAHLQPLCSTNDVNDGLLRSSASSVKSERSFSSSSSASGWNTSEEFETGQGLQGAFTSSAFLRSPCTCASRGVFLCIPCGQNLRAADTTYKRVWTWRSRYSTHIGGGLGTGLGQGNQGQKCCRGENCLETGGKAVCWVEIDCAEGTTRDHQREHEAGSSSQVGTPDYANNKPGYFQQEIEGIGGVVKKKVKKRVKVGATVWEFEDERGSGKYLEREAAGVVRSWCAWCGRVCPGEKDREDPLMDLVAV